MQQNDLIILYEDMHLIVINKQCNECVQKDKTGDTPLVDKVRSYIERRDQCKQFIEVTHRLDRPTSGIVVFAKTREALSAINALFQDKSTVTKRYWALVNKKPEKTKGALVHYLKKNSRLNKSFAYDKRVGGSKKALLDYSVICSSERYHLLEIILHTGRHHQIRAQLAAIGCLIKGDVKYGFKRGNSDRSIHLHAVALSFIHPIVNKKIELYAEPPRDPLWDYFIAVLNKIPEYSLPVKR